MIEYLSQLSQIVPLAALTVAVVLASGLSYIGLRG